MMVRLTALIVFLSVVAIFLGILIDSLVEDNSNECGECADFLFSGGSIWTATNENIEAVAVKGSKIISTGSFDEVNRYFCEGRTIYHSLEDRLLVPGFIDSHVHSLQGAIELTSVKLADCKSRNEIGKKVQRYILSNNIPTGKWVIGMGWNNENFIGEDHKVAPDRYLLDEFAPYHPLLICKLDLHQCVANTAALKSANIDLTNPPDIPGGIFQRNQSGNEINGILVDNAIKFVQEVMPKHTAEETEQLLRSSMKYYNERGITSIHNVANDVYSDVSNEFQAFHRIYTNWIAEPRVDNSGNRVVESSPFVRTYFAPSLSSIDYAESHFHTKVDKKYLKSGGVKGFMDGSIGSRSAVMFQPYIDDQPTSSSSHNNSNNTGIYVTELSEITRLIKAADDHHLQTLIHAIGDKAISQLIDIYEDIIRSSPHSDRRFRIEHCQHIRLVDQLRLSQLGIIASVQPAHLLDDAVYLHSILPPNNLGDAYAFKTMLNFGAVLAFGSDWPVADASPMLGIHAAVNRQFIPFNSTSEERFQEQQCISVDDALLAYTSRAAFAEFADELKGKIAPGYLADLVVLDNDITSCNYNEIRNTKVVTTMIDGQIVYRSSDQR